jgi:sarcosine oxidase subunit beta
MDKAAEVVIIGGGVIGASVAYHLAKRGCRDVVVLEKDRLGCGSTGKCPGGIRQQFSTPINVMLSLESVKFFEHFEEETGSPADFHQRGYLILATTEEELEQFQQNVALQRRLGLEVSLLSPHQVKEMLPQLNVRDILGATFCPTDGYADPYAVTQGFASAAKSMGIRIYEQTEAVGVKIRGSKIQGVMTTGGEISTSIVVNAAGAHAALVAQMVGRDLPIRPSRRHVFVTTPLEGMPDDCPMVIDFHTGFWFRKEGPGLLLGMRNPDELPGFDTSVDWSFLPTIARFASHRLPLLKDAGIIRGWAGLHEDTPDYQAILGEVPGVERFICACGFSGHGFMHSPAAGRLVAEIVINSKDLDVDISALAPDRFEKQRLPPKEKNFI